MTTGLIMPELATGPFRLRGWREIDGERKDMDLYARLREDPDPAGRTPP